MHNNSEETMMRLILEHDIVLTTVNWLTRGGLANMPRLKHIHAFGMKHGRIFDLIVFDEAHHTRAPTWQAVRNLAGVQDNRPGVPALKILNTTATQFLANGQRIYHDARTQTFTLLDGLAANPPYVKELCYLEIQGDGSPEELREMDRAKAEGARYVLPDLDVLLIAQAMARQLGIMRESQVGHKGMLLVNKVPSGVRRAHEVADLINQAQVGCISMAMWLLPVLKLARLPIAHKAFISDGSRLRLQVPILQEGGGFRPLRAVAYCSGMNEAGNDAMAQFTRADVTAKRCADIIVTVCLLSNVARYSAAYSSLIASIPITMSLCRWSPCRKASTSHCYLLSASRAASRALRLSTSTLVAQCVGLRPKAWGRVTSRSSALIILHTSLLMQ